MWETLYVILMVVLFVVAGRARRVEQRNFKDRTWAARVRKWEPDSRLEADFLEILRRLGYAEPALQVPIRAERLYQLDFAYMAERIAIEVDGPHHDEAGEVAADRERDHNLLEAGWRTVRVPWGVIRRGDAAVGRLLLEAGIPMATNDDLFEGRVLSAKGLTWPRAMRITAGDASIDLRRGYPAAQVLVLVELDGPGERWEIDRSAFRALKVTGWRIAVVTREMLLNRPADVAHWLSAHGVKTLGELDPVAPEVDGDDLPFSVA